jgi:hypothetical protein
MRARFYALLPVACLAASPVGTAHADGLCGLRASHVFAVDDWQATRDGKTGTTFVFLLKSLDGKAIRTVSGEIGLLPKDGAKAIWFPIKLDKPVGPGQDFTLGTTMPGQPAKPLSHDNVAALACVSALEYSDGSGVIVN